ncbi:EpsG family protein [Klebsiella michiganensis]
MGFIHHSHRIYFPINTYTNNRPLKGYSRGMEVYLLLYVILTFFIFLPKNTDKLTYPLAFCILLIVGAFRGSTVGTDILVYYRNFAPITFNEITWNVYTPFEPGFNLLMAFFKEYITNDYYAFYSFLFVITFSLLSFFIYKCSVRPIYSLFLLYSLFYYFSLFNYMRQYLALVLCLVYLYLYIERRWFNLIFYEVAVVFTAINIHISLLTFTILPFIHLFLTNRVISKKILVLILLMAVCFFYFKSYLINILVWATEFLSERYANYIRWGLYENASYSSIEMLMVASLCLIVILVVEDKRNLFFYIYFISVIFRIVFVPMVPMLGRVYFLYEIVSCIYFVNVYYSLNNRNIKLIFGLALLCFSLVFFTRGVINNANDVIPYTTAFD